MTEAHREQPMVAHTFTCYADRAIRQARRRADEKAKADKKPDGWDDGVHYYATPLEREEDQRAH